MKASRMLISTSKEAPVEAKIDSHVLLLRAGFIKSLVSGVYNFLPFGLRTLKKIEDIIREEMDKSGSLEILSSALQPKELWDESKRWDKYGNELFRLTDRHSREFCLGPTHEEVFTALARDLIKSNKNFPVNLYQIQTKYRDEMRPRFGLMRSREFIMKDAYSFDKSIDALGESYDLMYKTYSNIFDRFNINYKVVLADTGAIGGDGSHQFMALSDVGESDIAYCNTCGYAADLEKAEAIPNVFDSAEHLNVEKVHTPNMRTIEEVTSFLNIDSKKLCKSILYKDTLNNEFILALVRGDRQINEVKLVNALDINENYLVLADGKDFENVETVNGFVGPKNIKNCKIVVDNEISLESNLVIGANEKDYHLINVNYKVDFDGLVRDIKDVVEGDNCPNCSDKLHLERGIEIGQLFRLGTKYSSLMKATFQDEHGKNTPMEMGCYGIGVTRTLQAIVEQYHDDYGIKWPINVAPYHAVIVPINYEIEDQASLSNNIYNELIKSKVEVILDDRNAKAGFKFKDWELIGIPYIITCGKLAGEGIVELKDRSTNEKVELPFEEAIRIIKENVYKSKN